LKREISEKALMGELPPEVQGERASSGPVARRTPLTPAGRALRAKLPG
jgi:hypothetical protein